MASELRELGRLDEAETLLRQALAIEPQHATALAELGHIARRRGDLCGAGGIRGGGGGKSHPCWIKGGGSIRAARAWAARRGGSLAAAGAGD